MLNLVFATFERNCDYVARIRALKACSRFKVTEPRYIALFVVSISIKKLFSIDYVNIYLFLNIFCDRFCSC